MNDRRNDNGEWSSSVDRYSAFPQQHAKSEVLLARPAKRGVKAHPGLALVSCFAMLGALHLVDADRAHAQSVPKPAVTSPAAADTSDYILGPQDKIRLKVYAWRPSRDEIFEWKALNDVFTVGANGRISLPLIGEIPAGGSSLADLSKAITERLRANFGMVEAPVASTEVAQFRPFYINGEVEKPGEYAFRPGMTVLQAVSIAGGTARLHLNEFEMVRLERDYVVAESERQKYANELQAQLAQKERLDAEFQGKTELSFSAALASGAHHSIVAGILEQEQILFTTRQKSFASQISEFQRMREAAEAELASVQAQIQHQESYERVAQQEFKYVEGLIARQTMTQPRKNEAEKNLMQVRSERLRLESTLPKLRQDISKIEISLLEVKNTWMTKVASDLRAVQIGITEASRQLYMATLIVDSMTALNPKLSRLRNQPDKTPLKYSIVRASNGFTSEFTATEDTIVLPGDVIKAIPQSNDNLLLSQNDSRRLQPKRASLIGGSNN